MIDLNNNIGYEQLIDFINGNASLDMQERISKWLDEDIKNKNLLNELRAYYEINGDYKNLNFDTELALKRVNLKIQRRKRFSWYSVAASILLLLSFSFITKLVIDRDSSGETILVENLDSEVMKIVLPDNSTAWLDTDSRISYNDDFRGETRKVDMKGHVYFNVTKNKEKPFEIFAQDVYIKVLGTSFDVNEDAYRTHLKVNSGRVIFADRSNRENKLIITKNTGASYEDNSKQIIRVNKIDPNYKSWFTGVIRFNDQSIDVVCKYLSSYYKKEIKLKNPEDKIKRLTTTIDNLSIEEVKTTIEFALDIELSIE